MFELDTCFARLGQGRSGPVRSSGLVFFPTATIDFVVRRAEEVAVFMTYLGLGVRGCCFARVRGWGRLSWGDLNLRRLAGWLYSR